MYKLLHFQEICIQLPGRIFSIVQNKSDATFHFSFYSLFRRNYYTSNKILVPNHLKKEPDGMKDAVKEYDVKWTFQIDQVLNLEISIH